MNKFLKYLPCPRCQSNGRDTRGDNLGVWENGHQHCFSCGHHVFPKHYVPVSKETHAPKNKLPIDFTREVPATALKWLLQYGLPWSYWKEQIGFSPSEKRLVFLVGDPIQFSIGRLVEEPDETASSAKRRKWYVWGDSHKHAEIVGKPEGKAVVLVEDIVSAHKVVNAGEFVSIPLFGTEVHKPALYYLLMENKPVYLWLDKDQQVDVYRKAAQLQGLLGRYVRTVVTEKDPKALDFETIKERIQ